jgi:hypothetical protein
MVSSLGKLVTFAFVLLTFSAREARAWSRDGHRIVCRIAWQLLDQARRAEIERLTSAYRDPDGQPLVSFFDACAYADDVRGKSNSSASWSRFAVFTSWHQANVPRTTTKFPTPPCQACVITAVPAHADSLRRADNDRSKTEALLFLSHWLGDLHQPLHLGYADDRGGNDVRPIESDYYSAASLHVVWDVALLGKLMAGADWQEFADNLVADITPAQRASWIAGTASDWAQESYNLLTSVRFKYCEWQDIGGAATCVSPPGGRTLGADYQAEFGDDVAQRLQQAGVRLAELIRTNMP